MLSERINIKAGDFTYGQWLEISALSDEFADENSDSMEYISRLFDILHEYKLTAADWTLLAAYAINKDKHALSDEAFSNSIAGYLQEIQDGIVYWNEVCHQTLSYEPDMLEKQAGIDELPRQATLYRLARDFGQDPDTVYNWKWSKVYGILACDQQVAEFSKRYETLKREQDERARQNH